MPKFATGEEAAEQRAAQQGNFAGRVKYLAGEIKGGKQKPTFFRVLTERTGLRTVDIHMLVPTREAPKDYKGKWPEVMSCVCANDKAFAILDEKDNIIGWEAPDTHFGHCYIHEHMSGVLDKFGKPMSKTSSFTHGLVVLREPVREIENGPVIGFRDVMEEFEDRDGNKHQVPAIRMAQQKWSNFWGAIKSSAYISGTYCNRDFMVTKEGTEIAVTPMDPTPDHNPDKPSWQIYTDAVELMKIDIDATLTEQSSEEFYARFYDVTKPQPVQSGGSSKSAPDGTPPPADEEDSPEMQAEIDALRARVKANRAGTVTGPQGA